MGLFDRALNWGESKQFKVFEQRVKLVGAYEAELDLETDEELRARMDALRERGHAGEPLEQLQAECFAVVREVGRRQMGMRHFDVQLIGGMVLDSGAIAEMRTGEGKTLTATLAVVLNSLAGKGVHVVTVNDYLAQRDADWMNALYGPLGVSVGVLQTMQPYEEKRAAYACDVTYGTNSEFGFDYLRDNMAASLEEKVQHGGRFDEDGRPLATHFFAVVDEVDNILIDEARTPLIISGAPEQAADLYAKFARLARQLEPGKTPDGLDPRTKKEFVADFDYEFEEKHKTVAVTERGVAKAEKFLGIDHLYRAENGPLVNHLIQSLRAESLYKRDVDYAVIDGEVKIIDEFTGRILEGRRWSEGLHQAVEAKEGVRVQEENQTLATITLQNYFRLYDKLAGMTGTAMTEATEFMKIYKLPVVQIPTNRPMVRADRNDQVYKTRDGKWSAVEREIVDRHAHGQPVLVGTISVEVSALLVRAAPAPGDQPPRPERRHRDRPADGDRGRDDRRGRSPGRRHDRDEHGRPGVDIQLGGNAEHQTRLELAKLGLKPEDPDYDEHFAKVLPTIEERVKAQPGEGARVRRPVHRRHRAPRVPPDRQPAARPVRPPGRPRRVAVLPFGRGRPDPPVRGRSDLQDPRPARQPRRGRQRGADRGGDPLQADREGPAQGRGAELPPAQARPRVRRRDERAAARRLRPARPGPRGRRHGPGRPRGDRRRDRADGRRAHGRRLHRGLGPRRPVRRAQPELPGQLRPRRRRGSTRSTGRR